jgi:hypothetical protein
LSVDKAVDLMVDNLLALGKHTILISKRLVSMQIHHRIFRAVTRALSSST